MQEHIDIKQYNFKLYSLISMCKSDFTAFTCVRRPLRISVSKITTITQLTRVFIISHHLTEKNIKNELSINVSAI